MTTVIVDDEINRSVPILGSVRPTKAETEILAKRLIGAEFRLDGMPYVVWPDWDYAEC